MTESQKSNGSGNGSRLPSLDNIRKLVEFMDGGLGERGEKKRIPMDPVLGLIPVVGDAIPVVVSAVVIAKARELGAPTNLIVKMMVNVGIDFGVGSVPLMGDVFDFFYRAYRKNFNLLTQWLAEQEAGSAPSPAPPPTPVTIDLRADPPN